MDSWTFVYDGDGNRFEQVNPGGSTTLFLFGGLVVVEDGVQTNYYVISGMKVAYKNASGMNYLLSDHLGSVVGVTDSSGSLLEDTRYMPFGAVRDGVGIQGTDVGYTGQRGLPGTGLMDYNARFYDAGLGRFIQPDTIVPQEGNPQSWNRYSYTGNNPINFTDPSGNTHLADGGDIDINPCLINPNGRFCSVDYDDSTSFEVVKTKNHHSHSIKDDVSTNSGVDQDLYAQLFFTENFALPLLKGLEAADLYGLTNNQLFKSIKWITPSSFLELLVGGGRQWYKDSISPNSLTIGQRIGRIVIAGGEAILIDSVATISGVGFGAAGTEAIPGIGTVIGYGGGSYLASQVGEAYFESKNSSIFSFFGVGQ